MPTIILRNRDEKLFIRMENGNCYRLDATGSRAEADGLSLTLKQREQVEGMAYGHLIWCFIHACDKMHIVPYLAWCGISDETRESGPLYPPWGAIRLHEGFTFLAINIGDDSPEVWENN